MVNQIDAVYITTSEQSQFDSATKCRGVAVLFHGELTLNKQVLSIFRK